MSSAVAIAAISSAAIAAGSLAYGIASAPGSPQTQAPPPPSNSVQYDDNGDIISTQTFDSATNTWTTRGKNAEPEKPKNTVHAIGDGKLVDGKPVFQDEAGFAADTAEYQKKLADYEVKHAEWEKTKAANDIDKKKVSELRTKMLDNLNTTPEDRQKAYAEYQQAYTDAAHKSLDPQFDKINRTSDEQANATGMFGSRAYVDTKNELVKDKLAVDADIANQAVMAKEQLANTDRNYYANMLNQIDSGARADNLASAQIAKSASDSASQNYAGTIGYYNSINNSNLAKWQAQQAKSASFIGSGSNLAGGLMYLYGSKSGGGSSKPATTAEMNQPGYGWG